MDRPKICASIAAGSVEQAAEAIRSVERHEPDLMELRMDHIEKWGNAEMIRGATELPLIATNRRRDQGGLFAGSEDKRVASILEACDAGFDYVDLELTTRSLEDVASEVKEKGVKIIISSHDLHGTPVKSTLEKKLKRERSFSPDICKIVGTAKSYTDNLAYLSFLREHSDVRLVCFGMGIPGVPSRIFSPLFGGEFTYASAESNLESAPGQLTVRDLREIYRILGIHID
jgi:3-dehydroquinate dehydratase/shikimate dehydrogenase